MNKLFYRLFHRKGHGVHSPFAYNLITRVIEEELPYYAFDEIETRFKKRSNHGRLLFRLVTYFGCNQTVIIGNNPPHLSLYAALASGNKRLYVVNHERLPHQVRDFMIARRLPPVYYDEYIEKLPELLDQGSGETWRLIVYNENRPYDMTRLINNKCIFVINNTRKDKRQRKCWHEMRRSDRACVSIDMHNMGIIFFNDKLSKGNYKTYFNYD